MAGAEFKGTAEEGQRLHDAIEANCTCEVDEAGVYQKVCSLHKMLIDDQRALDGLLFMRRNAEVLMLQEWRGPKKK